MVMSVALAQGLGRECCDVFGNVMNNVMPWVNKQILHPAQVYEFILIIIPLIDV